MFWPARALLSIVACVVATPIFAQAPEPATMAFDGTYFGVSNTFEEGPRSCRRFGPPGTLTVVNGIARADKIERVRYGRIDGQVFSEFGQPEVAAIN